MLDAATAADARFTFKVGAVATHLLALVIVIDSVRQFKTFLSPTAPLLTLRLHCTRLMNAFSFCAPIGAVSWRVQHDFMRVSHVTVKRFHLVINTAAVLIGWLGILDMWLVHANHADAQRAKGWAVHFQSSHSWIGLTVMVCFTWQWLGGLVVLNHCSRYISIIQVARSKGTHALIGSLTLYGGLLAVATGVLSLAGRGDNVAAKDVAYKWLSMLIVAHAVAIGLTFAGPKPGSKGEAAGGGSVGAASRGEGDGVFKAIVDANNGAPPAVIAYGRGCSSRSISLAMALPLPLQSPPPPAAPAWGQHRPFSEGRPTTATRTYTREEIAKHTTADDCWVILFGKVYDVTNFLPDHPGGTEAPLLLAGGDATEQWLMLHSPSSSTSTARPSSSEPSPTRAGACVYVCVGACVCELR